MFFGKFVGCRLCRSDSGSYCAPGFCSARSVRTGSLCYRAGRFKFRALCRTRLRGCQRCRRSAANRSATHATKLHKSNLDSSPRSVTWSSTPEFRSSRTPPCPLDTTGPSRSSHRTVTCFRWVCVTLLIIVSVRPFAGCNLLSICFIQLPGGVRAGGSEEGLDSGRRPRPRRCGARGREKGRGETAGGAHRAEDMPARRPRHDGVRRAHR